ncbi:MAG: efflux RND transporter periplasmic adaptor subunit [Bacillota bacterium]|nr:efflux RND transporter periplasmic adaptor subunit [Bacillota bacterium]
MKITFLKNAAERIKRIRHRKTAIALAVLIAAGSVGGAFYAANSKKAGSGSKSVKTSAVSRQNIQKTLSSSGTISPKDTYSITSLAEGEVIECTFEAGDTVEKGDVLYRIDASSMDSQLSSANNTLNRSNKSYSRAVSDLAKAQSKYSGNTYKATKSGYIKELKISDGDKVGSNSTIATIYNDNNMSIRLPFLNVEAMQISVGQSAVLTLSDTLEEISGTVTAVSSRDETLDGGRLVRYVEISVENPGGLTETTAATAVVGDYASSGDGTFTADSDSDMSADLDSSVVCSKVLVHVGDYVTVGTPIFSIDAEDVKEILEKYEDSVDSAQSSVESAQSKLDSTQDSYDNYTITAPISGKVITKNTKVGDKIKGSSNSTTTLAVIYDLSTVTFEMSIDEVDITNVKVGQKVEVTADAFEGQTFEGEVTNVSMVGSTSNGVTNYPVTVTMTEYGDLLPGMNVEGVIILDSVDNALAVPVDALQRGNAVYVKDDSVTEAKGNVPAGFRKVEVQTGLTSDDYVEIKEGDLQEGDEIYITQSSVGSSNEMTGMPGMGGAPGGGFGGGSGGPSGGGSGGGSRSGGSGRSGGPMG